MVCRRGDIKRLEDPILDASGVCGRASMEEEVTISGHDGILKGDGGRIDHTLPKLGWVKLCKAPTVC